MAKKYFTVDILQVIVMHPVFPFKNRNQHQHWCCSGMASDKAIFVYFYQVISFILTVRPDSVVAALLSYVSILFENHSNNSQNEWKWFVIGPLEKSSVTDTFSVSRMMMIADLCLRFANTGITLGQSLVTAH